MKKLLADMHMHTLVSGHAYGTIREMAAAAAEKEERAREGHCHQPVQRRGGLPAVCRRCGDRAYRFQ